MIIIIILVSPFLPEGATGATKEYGNRSNIIQYSWKWGEVSSFLYSVKIYSYVRSSMKLTFSVSQYYTINFTTGLFGVRNSIMRYRFQVYVVKRILWGYKAIGRNGMKFLTLGSSFFFILFL